MDHDAYQVEQQLLHQPVQLRMGTDQEPSRGASVDAEKRRRQGHGARCTRSLKASRAIHADHGPLFALRPRLRKNFTALLRASRSVRRRVCPRVVQADAPGHGPHCALSRPARSKGAAALAGPYPRGESSANWGAGYCRFESKNPRVRPVHFPVGLDGVGVGVDLPRL